MAQSLININGVIRDMSELTFPATGLENMGAFVLNGNVVSVDTAKVAQLKEAEVQSIAGELTDTDERMMALALATVDLKMVDTTGMTKAQVRSAFKDRVVFYLRERRGI